VSDPKKTRERLERIYDALEESLENMSGEELREEIVAKGQDPEQVVRGVRGLIGGITKEHQQTKLREARTGHAAAVQAYAARKSRIPSDAAAQRAMYLQVAKNYPERFTMQHRELEAIPQEELVEILKQMDALGLLPDSES
jgi:hypothetical protein